MHRLRAAHRLSLSAGRGAAALASCSSSSSCGSSAASSSRIPLQAISFGSRSQSTAAGRSPLEVLGLEHGSSKADIKRRFYERAKQVHPDVSGADNTADFVALLAAFEQLMDEPSAAPGASNRSARHQAGPSAARGRPRWSQTRREYTLGELLCERLREADCTAATLQDVWREVKEMHEQDPEQHKATGLMLDMLVAAGVRTGGVDAARDLLRDGRRCGLVSGADFIVGLCALVKHGSADKSLTFEAVCEEAGEQLQRPEALEALHSAWYMHHGVDPLCAWTSGEGM